MAYSFTQQQRQQALLWLSLLHIIIIASSNYLVQIPITFLGLNATWGALTFPFIFLATDLTVRIFGAPLARRIILISMLPALCISYVMSTLFFQEEWLGMGSFSTINILAIRIACASFMAYLLGQLLDIHVFNRLRQLPVWWVAPGCSMLLGNISDTLAFFYIAFHNNSSDPFMAVHWPEIALVDYGFKLLVCFIFFLPIYGIMLNIIIKQLARSRRSVQLQLS